MVSLRDLLSFGSLALAPLAGRRAGGALRNPPRCATCAPYGRCVVTHLRDRSLLYPYPFTRSPVHPFTMFINGVGIAAPATRYTQAQCYEALQGSAAALPEQLRSAVKLVYFRGMKYREAADELGVPVGTVKSRLHSAVKRLGEAWEESQTPNN